MALALLAWTHYAQTVDKLLAIIFFSTLLCLSVIDMQRFCLLDILTLPLLWLGLLVNLDARFALLPDAVIGAAVGYLSLAVLNFIFSLIIGTRSIGMGDYKLLAAIGAWLGWQMLPILLFIASIIGVMLGVFQRNVRTRTRYLPFGPCLSAAAIIMALTGDKLLLAYQQFILR